MGLDPKYLESLPDSLVDMYGLVEMDILTDMARRISTYDYFIPAAMHQNQKLQELGMMQNEIIAKLSAITGQSQAEIVALLTEAGEQAIQDDLEYYTAAEVYTPDKVDTEALYEQLNAGLIQTEGAFKNLTRTTANTATQQFEFALDRAWTQINSGAFDYVTAIKNAIIDLSSQGLGAVKYPSGRVDSIEVAVRRAVVTGANQTASKTQEKLADQLDVELVEVTAHGGARPEHAKWQGKVFSRRGRVEIDGVVYEDLAKATGYGSGAGLCGWNCRHNFHPYIPGTARAWNDKQLAKLEEKNIEYNGVKMTEYEASQVQRKIEREIRKQKRTIAALEAAGEDASEYRSRLRNAQKSYTDFTKQTGIKKQNARTQVATGTGTATSAKNNAPKPQQPIANSVNSDIINLDGSVLTHRKTSNNDREIINKATYNKLTKPVVKKGGQIITATADNDWLRYLDERKATAVTIGDSLILRPDATTTEVLEEVYHFNQNRAGLNMQYSDKQRKIMNEIEAQEYLISVADKYKIPQAERDETKALLEDYKRQMEELKEAGEWE